MRELPSCCRFFIERVYFSASLPLLVFVKNASLLNPSLDPACTGGGFRPWLTLKVSVLESTRGDTDASALVQQLDGRLASVDSLSMAVRVRLSAIPSADEAIRDLFTFTFVVLHLFSAGRRHSYAVAKLLCLIERTKELQTEVQGIISSPHLSTTLIVGV